MKILFITSNSLASAGIFKNEIEILGEGYECHITAFIPDALEIIQKGIDKVVMYPYYIAPVNYKINRDADKDLRIFAGYYFWKQELLTNNIPTIVIQNRLLQPDNFEQELEKVKWENESNVTFFDHDFDWKTAEKLAELIRH